MGGVGIISYDLYCIKLRMSRVLEPLARSTRSHGGVTISTRLQLETFVENCWFTVEQLPIGTILGF